MKTLKELSKYTLARYQQKAADDLRFKGVDQGAKISHAISKGGDMRKTDPDIEKRSRKLDKRVIGIGKAANKLTQKTNEEKQKSFRSLVGPEGPGMKRLRAKQDAIPMTDKSGRVSRSRMQKKFGRFINTEEHMSEEESYAKIDEDEKFYYKIGHDKAMAGHERGETSDNYGPMATHYNAGYDAGMKKRKSTKPKVVGKDSYGRDIVKVEGHKTKKKYLKDLKMTMNQATLGDMSTALQKGGFQGKGQYEETEILEDGHTDVASAMRKCKTIMEDAGDIQTKLAMMGSVESLPSWWTNKLAVAAAYMDSMRDYLLYPTNEGHVKQDMIKKGYARGNRDVDPRMMIPKTKPKDKQMKLPLKEKHMTDGQMEKREKIVMAMKPKMKGFKDRYGDDAKNVMYATATKMAMKKEDTNLFEKAKKRKVNQKKLAGNDKFEADPTLTSQIMRPDNPSNDNDNKI